jgi:hypothetical protein
MKMNKIVLASLLSVSLLGASTAVFADTTTPGKTTTSFEVTGGTLSLDTKTTTLDFGKKSMLDFAKGDQNIPAGGDFNAVVTDTVGDGNGWTLSATYTGMTGKNTSNTLGDKLHINGKTLEFGGDSTTVFSASPADVKTAMKNAAGAMNVSAAGGKDGSISLEVPAANAKVDTYEGTISWVASTDTNDAANATTSNGVAVPEAPVAD